MEILKDFRNVLYTIPSIYYLGINLVLMFIVLFAGLGLLVNVGLVITQVTCMFLHFKTSAKS